MKGHCAYALSTYKKQPTGLNDPALQSRVELWFNGQCPHSASLVLNIFHTAVLQNITWNREAYIRLTNAPGIIQDVNVTESMLGFFRQFQLFGSGRQGASYIIQAVLIRLLCSFFVPMALCYHAAAYVVFPLNERISSAKHLQLMAGVGSIAYWASNFIFDMLLSVLYASLFTLAMAFFRHFLDWVHVGEKGSNLFVKLCCFRGMYCVCCVCVSFFLQHAVYLISRKFCDT